MTCTVHTVLHTTSVCLFFICLIESSWLFAGRSATYCEITQYSNCWQVWHEMKNRDPKGILHCACLSADRCAMTSMVNNKKSTGPGNMKVHKQRAYRHLCLQTYAQLYISSFIFNSGDPLNITVRSGAYYPPKEI